MSDSIVTLLVWKPDPLYVGKLPQPLCYALQESSSTYTLAQV